MQSAFWPASTVPIVLLPGGEQGQRLLELARTWVGLGLLGPALWVSPEDVTVASDAPPLILARVLRLGADREVVDLRRDLFEVLARDELRQVRVLKVRSATPRRELDVAQDAIAESLSRYVKHSVPSADPNQSIADQTLVLSESTLICAPTEFQVSERVGWATEDPGVIVVASPEDRSSPWSGDAFVRDNQRFVGFCLMHVATVAGLWNAAPLGTFDLFSQEASMQRSIWVSRVFVNAVIMDGFARRVAAGVLADAADGNSDLVDALTSTPPAGTAFIPEERRAHYVQRVVDGVFRIERAQLDYTPAEGFASRDKRRLTFGGQLASFASFALDKIAAMPRWVGRAIRRRASRSATATFHTDEGLAVVGADAIDYDLRDRALVALSERAAAEVLVARSAAAEFDDTAAVRSTPGLWARLREVMFGVLDGSSDLTEIGFAPIEDKTPIFLRVGDLVQPTLDRWTFLGADRPDDIPPSIGLEDLESVDVIRKAVIQWAGAADGPIGDRELECEQAATDLASLRSRHDELTMVLFEHELVELDDHGHAAVIKGKRAPSPKKSDGEPGIDAPIDLVALKREFIESPARISAAGRRVGAAEALREVAQEDREARDGLLSDLDKWIAGHHASVYGQIVSGMAVRREQAATDLAAVEAELGNVALPTPGQLKVLRQSFHRRVSLGTLIVLAALGVYFTIETSLPGAERAALWPQGWQATSITAGAIVIILLAALVTYYRGWSRIERRVVEIGDRLEWAAAAVHHTRHELRRMEVLHRQAHEWLRLLADVLHHPWAVRESWLASAIPAVDRSSLPYAMRLAVTREDDPVAVGRMKREASRALMVKGWRARAFARLLDELGARLGYDPSTLGVDALDADLPHASNHSRRILMEHAGDPVILGALAQAYLRDIVAEVQGVSLSHSSPRVTVIGADPLGADDGPLALDASLREPSVEWDRFLLDSLVGRSNPVTPIGSLGIAEMALAEAHHENVHSHLLVPDRLKNEIEARHVRSLTITGYTDSEVRPLDLVLRIDVAGPIPVSAARLWEKANGTPRAASVTGGRESRAGL